MLWHVCVDDGAWGSSVTSLSPISTLTTVVCTLLPCQCKHDAGQGGGAKMNYTRLCCQPRENSLLRIIITTTQSQYPASINSNHRFWGPSQVNPPLRIRAHTSLSTPLRAI